MQTFLPNPDFYESGLLLDNRRLFNQINEGMIIFRSLVGLTSDWKDPDAWSNHAAVKMWRGHETALASYILNICQVAQMRQIGVNGDTVSRTVKFLDAYLSRRTVNYPCWLGDERLHSSHRAALLSKDFEYYSKFGWAESPLTPDKKGSLPYYWPSATC